MLKLRGLIVFGLLALTSISPAFAQSDSLTQEPSQPYVTQAAIGDMFEVQSSKLALTHSHDAKVKAFANRMIRDHTASSNQLKNILKTEELPLIPPTKLDDAHQQMLDELAKAQGPDFDKQYLDMQMKGHQQALALHQGYAQNGTEPKLKVFAQKVTKVVQMHLSMLQQLQH